MRRIYRHAETGFDKLTSIATTILGNSLTFIFAFCVVVWWWYDNLSTSPGKHLLISDIIIGCTFLSLFIIQKSSNKFSAALHVKINELVAANENARNAVMTVDDKTEHEIIEISKEYIDLAEQVDDEIKRESDDQV